jgi:nitrite reductase/ring-hydroxylating ferredoxin subunit/uncharacterized membrane protein
MKSTAHFRGHPVHPSLIPFPFAFLIGGALADVGSTIFDKPELTIVAGWLIAAGVVSALAAAVPGLIDYLGTVPPDSTGKMRATRHGLLMIGATTLFAIAFVLRDGTGDIVASAIELAGVLALVIAGWMGGTLVIRNQIGIDHRYAGAGKWNEQRVERGTEGVADVAATDELQLDQLKLVRVGRRRIAVGRTELGFAAFDDHCPHRGGSLADGVLICGTVQCPWHGSQFDVRTGALKAGPAKEGIAAWQATESGGRVEVGGL